MTHDSALPAESQTSLVRRTLTDPEWRAGAAWVGSTITGGLVLGAAGIAGAAWFLQWTALSYADRFGVDLHVIATDAASNIGGTILWLIAAILTAGVFGYGTAKALDDPLIKSKYGRQSAEMVLLKEELAELRREVDQP